jgi:uncharacterized membrane protein (DUF4010 family)
VRDHVVVKYVVTNFMSYLSVRVLGAQAGLVVRAICGCCAASEVEYYGAAVWADGRRNCHTLAEEETQRDVLIDLWDGGIHGA